MRLFTVAEEGGLLEYVSVLKWLMSDHPFWGFEIAGWRVVHDSVRERRGYRPWRAHRPYRGPAL